MVDPVTIALGRVRYCERVSVCASAVLREGTCVRVCGTARGGLCARVRYYARSCVHVCGTTRGELCARVRY
eukprot:429873-Rhodomonas_salina.1